VSGKYRLEEARADRMIKLPYILESNPHLFYSFRGLKIQMRIRIAAERWILEK